MRLSANPGDAGYIAYRALIRRGVIPVVTADGVEVERCVTADTKRGVATIFDVDRLYGKAQCKP